MKRKNFTLIELLVVITIIIILVGLAAGAYAVVMGKAKETKTRSSIVNMETAIEQYRSAYGYYPFTPSMAQADAIVNNEVTGGYNILLTTLSGSDQSLNPRKLKLMAIEGNGTLKDSWGNDLFVTLDLNYDEILLDSKLYGTGDLTGGIAIWSMGRDGAHSATDADATNDDNISSWD